MAQRIETIEWGQFTEPKRLGDNMRLMQTSLAEPPDVSELPHDQKITFDNVTLCNEHLETQRIVGFDGSDERARTIDMLRIQVLRTMNEQGWQVLAVAAPSSGCGTTFTAINLAASLTRQSDKSVLLVDFHLRKPDVAKCLGLSRPFGLQDYLSGDAEFQDVVINAKHFGRELWVLPTVKPIDNSIDFITSKRIHMLMEELRRFSREAIIILDLPPILTCPDAVAMLTHADCLLLVLAAGHSMHAELEHCRSLLGSTNVAAVVLNMDREAPEIAN